MNMVSMSISKEGERQRYLPLEIRMQMYDDVIKLRKKGLTYKEIQKRIYEEYEIRLLLKMIYRWVKGKHHPLGKVNKFDGNPSLDLAYIIGAISSDGDLNKHLTQYYLRLRVNDKEFAEEFGKCLAKILKRNKPYKPFWIEKSKLWEVKGCSILLFKFLSKPFEELKPYIEYSKDCISSFLRALFDAEGSIHRKILLLYNTDEGLLNYAKHLLKKYFDIDSTIHLGAKKGKVNRSRNGIVAKYNKDYYYLYIRIKSLSNFCKFINFSIKRKQQNLIKAIKTIDFLPPLFLSLFLLKFSLYPY